MSCHEIGYGGENTGDAGTHRSVTNPALGGDRGERYFPIVSK